MGRMGKRQASAAILSIFGVLLLLSAVCLTVTEVAMSHGLIVAGVGSTLVFSAMLVNLHAAKRIRQKGHR